MCTKLVSVIIPIYNVEAYVKEAIQSIQKQTYKNLEIIIIDDGSSDSSYEIVNELAKHDPRIQLYKNKENLKIVKTLNRALTLAKGEYIARMDGDDISALDRIEKKIKFLEENPKIDLIGCSIKAIDSNGNIIGQTTHYSDQKLLLATLKYVTPVSHIWVARRNVYDRLNGYREIPGVEDYDFLLRMNSIGLNYTNLESYFGYFVRLGRDGNTINRLGLIQRKMHLYAYDLYKMRLRNNNLDNFNSKNLRKHIKTYSFLEKIHNVSSRYLYKAIKAKGGKKYLKCLWYLFCSLISPYQINYLIQRFKYRVIKNKYLK